MRDDSGRFAPGYSGNPGGRPKGTSIRAALRARLEQCPAGEDPRSYAQRLADALLTDALARDGQSRKLVLEHIDGKPTVMVDFAPLVRIIDADDEEGLAEAETLGLTVIIDDIPDDAS